MLFGAQFKTLQLRPACVQGQGHCGFMLQNCLSQISSQKNCPHNPDWLHVLGQMFFCTVPLVGRTTLPAEQNPESVGSECEGQEQFPGQHCPHLHCHSALEAGRSSIGGVGESEEAPGRGREECAGDFCLWVLRLITTPGWGVLVQGQGQRSLFCPECGLTPCRCGPPQLGA